MELQFDGQPTTAPGPLAPQQLTQRRVAVEVNGEILPRGQHASPVLQAGDAVETVHALGGG